jgi:putative ABC transport system substrate-binding protein
MDRRRLLLTSVAGALARPLAAEGQQAGKIARIGYLTVDNPSVTPHHPETFRQELRGLGYVEGRNLVIDYRSAEGRIERLPALATELLASKADVIFAPSTVAALAAKQVTSVVPIVSVSIAVSSGLVSSLARPGGNVTGLAFFSPDAGRQVPGTTETGRPVDQSGGGPVAPGGPGRTHGNGRRPC